VTKPKPGRPRGPNKGWQIHLRVTPDQRAAIVAMAKRRRKSVASIAKALLLWEAGAPPEGVRDVELLYAVAKAQDQEEGEE
jgi:hypothetical protein